MIEEVRRCAERGRQGYQDHALMYLTRYESRRAAPPRAATRTVKLPDPAALPSNVTPLVQPAAEARPAAEVRPTTRPISQPLPAQRPSTRPRPGSSRSAAARREAPRAAVDFLRRRAQELSRALPRLWRRRRSAGADPLP